MQKYKGKKPKYTKKVPDGRGNKNNRRAEEVEDTVASMTNDASWYSRFPQLLKDAASIPYSFLAGAPFSIDPTETGVTYYNNLYIPGVCALSYIPTIGDAGTAGDPVNIAARNIYTYVRHVNSGHANYDSPDLMMYLLAMDSLISYHAFMKRIYGVARLYSPSNRYYPNTVLRAMGVAYEDIYANLADFRAYINMFAIKLSSLCVPKSMDFYTRHRWMNEGLYVDSTSVKAQTFMFVPSGALKFTNTGSTGSELTYYSYLDMATVGGDAPAALGFKQLQMIGTSLMDGIMNDEDFNIMSGDILKAFGENGVLMVDTIDENFTILPTYDEEVLTQIHNATICAGGIAYYSITQNPAINQGVIQSQLAIKGAVGVSTSIEYLKIARMLNTPRDDMTPADTMVASRLMCASYQTGEWHDPSKPDVGVPIYRPLAYGSEVITQATIYYPEFAGSAFEPYSFDNFVGGTTSVTAGMLSLIRVPQFDWAPQLWVNQQVGGVTAKVVPAFDVNNFTIIRTATLSNLHQVAMISLFDVPLTTMGNR